MAKNVIFKTSNDAVTVLSISDSDGLKKPGQVRVTKDMCRQGKGIRRRSRQTSFVVIVALRPLAAFYS